VSNQNDFFSVREIPEWTDSVAVFMCVSFLVAMGFPDRR
jgi:hypothetical protein